MKKPSGMLVLTTVAKKSDAAKLAALLVRGRYAACVNVVSPVESHYEWQGKLHAEREWLLLMKTTAAAYPKLERKLKTVHPYECPEIVAFRMDRVAKAYARWLARGAGTKR